MSTAQPAVATAPPAAPPEAPPDAPRALPRSLLRMAVGDDVLAIPIEDVREILQVTRMTPLPRTPSFVRGVMNLRGSVVAVIDLGARLGRPVAELGRRSCIVVVDLEPGREAAVGAADEAGPADAGPESALTVGLLVDAVFEVFDRAAHEIEAVPPLGTRIAAECLQGMTRAGGQVIGVLALRQVLSQRELVALIAAHQPQPAPAARPQAAGLLP